MGVFGASCNFSSYLISMIMIPLYFQVPKTNTLINGSHINPVVITEVKLWFYLIANFRNRNKAAQNNICFSLDTGFHGNAQSAS